MSEESFNAYLERAIPSYAKDNIESGRWEETDAILRSRMAHEELLPRGVITPGNHLFEIRDINEDITVGHAWVSIDDTENIKTAFIYDIEIEEKYRRKGYATSALSNIEDFVSTMGVSSLGLHVFHFNEAAKSLYARYGFNIVSQNMQKQLSQKAPDKSLQATACRDD